MSDTGTHSGLKSFVLVPLIYLFQILFVIFSQKYIELNISQRVGAVKKSDRKNSSFLRKNIFQISVNTRN
jgi:hypothetical protein